MITNHYDVLSGTSIFGYRLPLRVIIRVAIPGTKISLRCLRLRYFSQLKPVVRTNLEGSLEIAVTSPVSGKLWPHGLVAHLTGDLVNSVWTIHGVWLQS